MKKLLVGIGLICSFSAAAVDVPQKLEMFRILDTDSGLCLAPKELKEQGKVTLNRCGAVESYWVNLGDKIAPVSDTKLALSGDVGSLFLSAESSLTVHQDGSIKGSLVGFEQQVCLDRWALQSKLVNEGQSLHWLTECQYANQDPAYYMQLLKGDGELHQWHKDVTYHQGEMVLYDGKTWVARWETRFAEPLQGEYDWQAWIEVQQ